MTEPYLASFITEMRSYVTDLRSQTLVMASPTRSGESAARALHAIQRLGHTIAGLSETLQIVDFVQLGAALDDVLLTFLRVGDAPPGSIVGPLTRLAVYFELRVNAIESYQHYVPPSPEEAVEAERLQKALRAFAPPPLPQSGAEPSPLRSPADVSYATSGALLLLEALSEEDHALIGDEDDSDTLSSLSPQGQAAVAAFLRARLGETRGGPHPPPPRATPDVIREFIDEVADTATQQRLALLQVQVPESAHDALEELFRLAHRIKGAAFTVGYMTITTVANMQETLLQALRQGKLALTATVLQWLIAGVDALARLGEQVSDSGSDEGAPQILSWLHEHYVGILANISDVRAPDAAIPPPLPGPVGANGKPGALPPAPSMVRVALRQVDQVIATIGSQQINRMELERLRGVAARGERELAQVIGRLTGLEDRLHHERIYRLFAMLGDAVSPTRRPMLNEEFEELMTRVGEVIGDLRAIDLDMESALNQLARHGAYHDYLTEMAQRDVLALRLVPFNELLPQLALTLRATAIAEGKEAALVPLGEAVELDRDVFAQLVDPLLQLVRNAVVHGIESPEERRELGKPERARVTVRTVGEDDGVVIEVQDDGRGISPQQVIAMARLLPGPDGQPLLSDERAAQLSDAEALDLLFLPDFSTVAAVRPTAGRGMGLPTVKRAVEAVRGTIALTSKPGQGTTFRLHVPVSLGTVRGQYLRAGGYGYVVPVGDYRHFVAITPERVRDEGGQLCVLVQEGADAPRPVPLITLGTVLEHPELECAGDTGLLAIIDDQEYIIIADRAVEDEDQPEDPQPPPQTMVARPVPAVLRRRGIRQATVSRHGELFLILDLPALIRRAVARGALATSSTSATPSLAPQPCDHILVVDDSPSIQRGLWQTLTTAGYSVEQARDGQMAIDTLKRAIPRLMILDVEMPQLDGFGVLRAMRQDPRYDQVPVIMLTSRVAALYRAQALDLGVAEYLTKPTATDELLRAVERALAATVPAR